MSLLIDNRGSGLSVGKGYPSKSPFCKKSQFVLCVKAEIVPGELVVRHPSQRDTTLEHDKSNQ